MRHFRTAAGAVMICLMCAGISGCGAYKPYTYRNDREEMQGPGLFSGKDGVFTIWGKAPEEGPPDSQDQEDTKKEAAEKDRLNGQ